MGRPLHPVPSASESSQASSEIRTLTSSCKNQKSPGPHITWGFKDLKLICFVCVQNTVVYQWLCLSRSAAGLRNLSALLQLGNTHEVRNYVSVVATVLNRLSLDAEANTHAQRLIRNVLICTVCELESGTAEQVHTDTHTYTQNYTGLWTNILLISISVCVFQRNIFNNMWLNPQESMVDSICTLKDLLQVSNQVSGGWSSFIRSNSH